MPERFHRLRRELAEEVGLVFPDYRWDSLRPALQALLPMVELGLPRDRERRAAVLACVTVAKTGFYRDEPLYRVLRDELIPPLVAGGRVPRLWSAGCATGEEPWSIAALLEQKAPRLAECPPCLLATDLVPSHIEIARAGVYRSPDPRPFGLPELFGPVGEPDDPVSIRDALRSLVEFRVHNVAREEPPRRELDLISCRNVLIYLERKDSRRVIGRLVEALRPGGVLILGANETLVPPRDDLELALRGPVFFHRKR